MLKLCTYNALKVLHENNPENIALTELWNIIERCRILRQELNDWANYSKHKGGLGFVGLKPESPVQIVIGKPGGGYEVRTSEFEPISIDMDQCVEKVISAHEALINCMNELMDYIDFQAAQHSIDEQGRFVFPDKSSYRKVTL